MQVALWSQKSQGRCQVGVLKYITRKLSMQQEVLERTNRLLLWYDTDHIENDASNNSSILACAQKRTISEPRGTTRQQQAIAKTPAKWSAYQIPSVIVVVVVLLFKVWFVKSHSQKPQEDLNPVVTGEHYSTCNCISFYTICWMYYYILQIKCDYKINRVYSLPREHVF
jgi:hypothetical protein